MSAAADAETCHRLGSLWAAHLPAHAASLVELFTTEVPGYAEIPRGTLQRQVQSMCQAIVDHFLGGAGQLVREAPAEYGRTRADAKVPLSSVLHAYRLGWVKFWSDALIEAAKTGSPTQSELLALSTEYFELSNQFTQVTIQAYRERSGEIEMQVEKERSATLEAVLLGLLDDEQLTEAAALLHLPHSGDFVVVAAVPPQPGRGALVNAYHELLRRGVGSAWRLNPDFEIGLVSLAGSSNWDRLVSWLTGTGVRVGLSRRFSSLQDTPRAVHRARLAESSMPRGAREIRSFDENPLSILVAAAPSTASLVTESVLGPVLALPEEEQALLLGTLEAWFAADGSTAVTADRLYLHTNSVRNRLKRIEDLTGRRLRHPTDLAMLHTALVAVPLVGRRRIEQATDS